MGQKLHSRVDVWKKLLLDFGKRNRLINFRESKRSNVKIIFPSYESLYKSIVVQEKEIEFPYVIEHFKSFENNDDENELYEVISEGEVKLSQSYKESQKTLKRLRYKSKTSIEEQGINILYLAFGLLNWKERDDSSQILSSPLILVPVKLTIESLNSPYKLSLYEDEVVVNPTLAYKLYNDFGISIPDFDANHDEIDSFFNSLEVLFNSKGWSIDRCVNLTTLSFLKINMYKDLERNEEKLSSNNVIAAIVGEQPSINISDELNNFDHDKNELPIDTFQVVDADSSQQDAILLSKKGISFVLQGPPGTGKSQTITNIISEALADGKKVLFVSEKVAALQVVYNRLAKVGLADFCFALHSHKANKKNILNELSNSISIDRKKVREEALHQLIVLEKKRQELNEYQKELHTPCSRLNLSIFDVNGRLAKLEKAPDVVFDLEDVEKFSREQLEDQIYLLKQLAITLGKRSIDYKKNVWRDSNVKFLSNELRHDIDANLSVCLYCLPKIETSFKDCCSRLGLIINPSMEGFYHIIEVLKVAEDSYIIPWKWVYDENFESLYSDLEQYRKLTYCINEQNIQIKKIYSDDIESCDTNLYKNTLVNSIDLLNKDLKCTNNDILAEKSSEIKEKLLNYRNSLNDLYNDFENLTNKIGLVESDITFGVCKNVLSVFESLLSFSKYVPTKNWFDRKEFLRIKKSLNDCKLLHNEYKETKQTILNQCDPEIFSQDLYPMLQRFRCEYNTNFRFLKKDYRSDIKLLKGYLSNVSKISYQEALYLLTLLKDTSNKFDEIKNNQEQYISDFGDYYNNIESDWNIIENSIRSFDDMLSKVGDIPLKLQNLLIEKSIPTNKLEAFINKYNQSYFEDIYDNLNILLVDECNDNINIQNIINKLDYLIDNLSEFIYPFIRITSKRKEKSTFTNIITELDYISDFKANKDLLKDKYEYISVRFGNYYNGLETDWDILNKALSYAEKIKEYAVKYNLPKDFICNLCTDKNFVEYCLASLNDFHTLSNEIDKSLKWYLSLFEDSTVFYKYDFTDLKNRIESCKENKHLLEEWVDYCSNKQKCKEAKLNSYIVEIENINISSDNIVDAYLKRFYNLWLDKILPQIPSVLNFRGKLHEQTIADFCALDKEQFKIAQARVRERVMSRMPNFDAITTTKDEIGILKRELNKQRRLMPLRKLFMSIPNLITSLKPCFMMSPLSVSVFLEADCYDFDMVIFDEASQVHTEDAIGAIMRGKQAIIVGDSKQLPPTNFFTSSLSDEDYDSEKNEEDEYAGAYESILDEAVSVLPERELRWHYRSRHEHLIAFSNIKIYNSSLITFPSSTEKAQDFGVEYIYVSNGVYDRSGKRNNPIEAKKVADLVFEHIIKHPDRSLGVVTFSESQQNAIEAIIRQRRILDNSYELFFSEDKDEPFFIKNLENVQGDERDTIIFSIGYAHDNKGIMYMNFGPLSRDGGYRRLNVAITRAKYNVKLVGSILPTDIDISKVSSDGVKLLRSYIEFAQQGISALENELKYNNKLEFDSPFEESIYDFLVSKGYNVITQVGCSGFRIDMAVKDPKHEGKFTIGIECDGATYHSSRTARERDRLRQEILESMGWKIYRIWSTDWIKNPKYEKEKLVDAIEKSINNIFVSEEKKLVKQVSETVNDIVIEEKIENQHSNKNNFVKYELGNPYDYMNISRSNAVKKIIEIEQPIHFEELCRRIAPLYSRQKATSFVKYEIRQLLNYDLKNEIEEHNMFISLKGFNNLKVRIPEEENGYVRPINYICDEELLLAMVTIAENSYGITSDDLLVVTARELGYKRTGENITSTLHRIYSNALAEGKLKEVNGKVIVCDNSKN